MELRLAALAGLVAGLAIEPFTALANWQYTQWGMLPEQVVAASRGTARLEHDNGSLAGAVGGLLLAKGQITIDNFDFSVGFYFDSKKRVLKSVFLTLPKCSTLDASRLKEVLNLKYGAPRARFYNLVTKWVSPFAPDIITFTPGNSCSIEYAPLPTTL